MKGPQFIQCADCGMGAVKRSTRQRYCERCSTIRDRERKRLWAAAHHQPRTPRQREQITARAEARRRLGAQWGGDGSIAWSPSEVGLSCAWRVRVAVPFSYGFSKNAVWSMAGGGGHVFARKRTVALRAHLRDTLRLALGATKPVEAKVFVDIFVQKPDHKGDAINVVDVVCDAVKDALGIDDRWFALRAVDWEIVKNGKPTIWVGVGQEANEHHRVCSLCGRILPLDAFTRSKGLPLGRSRECRECRTGVAAGHA